MSDKLSIWLKDPVIKQPCNAYNGILHPTFYYTKKEQIKRKYESIKENTRYNDINILFTHLVDYCYVNKILELNGSPVINSNMKRAFINFVYENSRKN